MNGEGLRGRKPHSTRIRTRWISSRGMVAHKKEECECGVEWKSCLTLAVGSTGTRNDERERENSNTAETGEGRRSEAALHARLVLLTAHQETRINDHFHQKPFRMFAHYLGCPSAQKKPAVS